RQVGRERLGRLVELLVLLELVGIGEPRGRRFRVLDGRLLQRRLRLAAGARPGEEVLEHLADARRPGTDPEEHEAEDEHAGEQDEDHLAVLPQPAEEQLLLVARPLGLLGPRGRVRRYGSIRLRAALAVLRTSCHAVSPWRYRVVPSTIVSRTEAG